MTTKQGFKRIILHHTGGSYAPNNVDFNAYHFCIDDQGNIYNGRYKPEDNLDCNDRHYAAHTFKGNTGSIGIAACANFNFNLRDKHTQYPITKQQFESMCKFSAMMCKKYKIKSDQVYTHYGFDLAHNIKQGKIDITYLPFKPELTPIQVQDYFRNKINYYINKCKL